MFEFLDDILGLPNFKAINIDVNENCICIDLEHTSDSSVCPHCHKETQELHQNHTRTVRDLSISGKPCYLRFVKRRFYCPDCCSPFSESLAFVDPNRFYSNRYQNHIYQLICHSTVTETATIEGLTYEIVEGIFIYEAKKRIPSSPFENLKKLGVDEISERKGHQSFDLILYNLETGKPVEVLQGRTKKQFRQYLNNNLTDEIKNNIEEICIDMWRPYADVIVEVLPHAKLVIDRFHVMKSVNKELKELKNEKKKNLPENAKNCHYPLLKNKENLNDKQKIILQNIYNASPILKQAHILKEQFRSIFEANIHPKKARKKLKKWISKAYKCDLFTSTIGTLNNWFNSILNYFHTRTTNGPAEGANNKIKVIKRRAYGFRNFGNFRLRILTAF